MNLQEILIATIALFIIVDPITNSVFFYIMTSHFDEEKRKKVIRSSVMVATSVLLLFALAGDLMLMPFGVTIPDLKIATGIILIVYSIQGMLGESEAKVVDPESIAVVPMAIPLLAGPGAISTVIYYRSTCGVLCTVLAILIVMPVSLVLLYNGERLLKFMGKNGAVALARIFALILAALGVAMVREGVKEIMG